MLKKQSGAVLIVSLIIVIAVTALVLSGTQSTLMQEKMTASMRDLHISLEVAESGVRDAENLIDALTDVSSFANVETGGKYSIGTGPTDLFAEATWADNLTTAATIEVSDENIVARYFIEYLGLVKTLSDEANMNVTGYGAGELESTTHGFKIVVRATGRTGYSERIIVSYFGKIF